MGDDKGLRHESSWAHTHEAISAKGKGSVILADPHKEQRIKDKKGIVTARTRKLLTEPTSELGREKE